MELIQVIKSTKEIILNHNLNDNNLFDDIFQRSEILIHQFENSDQTLTQEIKIQQLNELLITEVCKRKLLEDELEKERRQRDEYITDVIAQFEKEVRHNYQTLKKKKNGLEEKLSIASEQRLVLIKEVKSLSTELDEIYSAYDSLLAMNLRLEEMIKQLQQFILLQFHEITTSSSSKIQTNDKKEPEGGEGGEDGEGEEEQVLMTHEEYISSLNSSLKSPQLLLSSDITHTLGDLTQYSFPSNMMTLFDQTYHLLESSTELRINKRDSLNLSDHKNSERIIQEQSDVNEENNGDEEIPSKNSLFGKMLNLDPTTLLDNLRNPSASTSTSTSTAASTTNSSSANDVSRRLRSASVTLSTASQGLLSSIMNYNENSHQLNSEKGSKSSSPAEVSLEQKPSSSAASSAPPVVYYCSRCHGTVEGPKYSTCKCDIPSVQNIDSHHQQPHTTTPSTTNSNTTSTPPSTSTSNILQQNFWKGMYETKSLLTTAAVNLFQKRKSGQFVDPQIPSSEAPLSSETAPVGGPEKEERNKSQEKKLDSDDEDVEDMEEKANDTSQPAAPATTTTTATIAAVFPKMTETEDEDEDNEKDNQGEDQAQGEDQKEEGEQLEDQDETVNKESTTAGGEMQNEE